MGEHCFDKLHEECGVFGIYDRGGEDVLSDVSFTANAGEILGKLDVFVLESTAVAVDRLRIINGMIDENPDLLLSTALQNNRAKYQSDLWRGCSELCLSPQARAKLGGLAAQKAKESKDPLLEALRPDD